MHDAWQRTGVEVQSLPDCWTVRLAQRGKGRLTNMHNQQRSTRHELIAKHKGRVTTTSHIPASTRR